MRKIGKPLKKIGKLLQKAERHCGKQKGIAESRKPLTKVRKLLRKIGKPLRKIGKRARKIGLRVRKIGFRARKILIFPRDSLASGNFGVSFCYQICYHVCAWIYFVELKYSQLKINHHSNTPSTKGDQRQNLQWCIYQGCQVTRRSSLVPFFQHFLWCHNNFYWFFWIFLATLIGHKTNDKLVTLHAPSSAKTTSSYLP